MKYLINKYCSSFFFSFFFFKTKNISYVEKKVKIKMKEKLFSFYEEKNTNHNPHACILRQKRSRNTCISYSAIGCNFSTVFFTKANFNLILNFYAEYYIVTGNTSHCQKSSQL